MKSVRPLLLICAVAAGACGATMSIPAVAKESTPLSHRTADMPTAGDFRSTMNALVDKVDIPTESFVLANGLRVIVHSDRATPIVMVSVWYDVGSKHEVPGRSGFAHLFEHLMFNGSENVPGDYLAPLVSVGAKLNGTTSVDRTNYYEVMPTSALERALFMESDRMGHLLGALSQAKLDQQRAVVKNEKRNGDQSPTSIVTYMTRAALYPRGHPYGHTIIGSMKDLEAATLDDARDFFRRHYGPNNATLILAGDIDPAKARVLVTKYFGDIPRGPASAHAPAGPVPMTRAINEVVSAPVKKPILYRTWSVPGSDHPDGIVLEMVKDVMFNGKPGSFVNRLVEEQKLFDDVQVSNDSSVHAGSFSIVAKVREGVDVATARGALDRELARFLGSPPPQAAVERSLASHVYATLGKLDSLPGRVEALGDGLIRGDPNRYKVDLRIYANQTPRDIQTIARRWLDRPSYDLLVTPGPRVTPKDDVETAGSVPGTPTEPSDMVASRKSQVPAGQRGPLPAVASPPAIRSPVIEHARLGNGIPIIYTNYAAVPTTSLRLVIDGGELNELPEDAGALEMMYSTLDAGYGSDDEAAIERRKALLGISLESVVNASDGAITLNAPDTSLPVALKSLRDMLTDPAFTPQSIEQKKSFVLERRGGGALGDADRSNMSLARMVDAGSPYLRLMQPADPVAIARIDRARVVAAFNRWVRPEHAHVEVVSSRPLAELLPLLERTLGSWRPSGVAETIPPVSYAPMPAMRQILLVDVPGAVHASVRGGQLLSLPYDQPAGRQYEALYLANAVLGGDVSSRLFATLRQKNGWTYGVDTSVQVRRYGSSINLDAEFQQDKVGAALAEIMKEMRGIVSDRPITDAEFETARSSVLGTLPLLSSGTAGLGSVLSDLAGAADRNGFIRRFSRRYRDVSSADANAALRRYLSIDRWVWVISGDAKIIGPQLEGLGLPVKVLGAADR